MPKPRSPERPPKKKAEPKSAVVTRKAARQRSPLPVYVHDASIEQLEVGAAALSLGGNEGDFEAFGQSPAFIRRVERAQLEDAVEVPSDRRSQGGAEPEPRSLRSDRFDNRVDNKVYPALIAQLLNICVSEASEVRCAFANRNRQKYKNIFSRYEHNLSERDRSIIKGALFYLYEFSRVKSIDADTALWMLGIYEIPSSQIISYTSKEVLKGIAKDHGLLYSNKKAEDLVESIRGVIDPSS
ncbi:hypothetical protein [carnivorous sponge associated iridovirus]|jgi:hypothetical protein|nr:hypothetical protein [carnivorous sponge associated iridovirus]